MVRTQEQEEVDRKSFIDETKAIFALLIPVAFLLNVWRAMSIFDLTGGDATALIGGTTLLTSVASFHVCP